MLYGPDDPFAITDDDDRAAADAARYGLVAIDAATAPAPIALTASLRATSIPGCFVFGMVDGTLPFPVTCECGAASRGARSYGETVAQVTRCLAFRMPAIVMYIGGRS